MITIENIGYHIGHNTLLKEVYLQFHPGKLNLIIGPNGAGKSTLIKILCNQILPDTGSVLFEQRDIKSISVKEMAKMRAVLSQNIELVFPMKVNEVVMMGRYPHFNASPQKRDFDICEETMSYFGVSDLASRNYMTLSGGEKQRTHFARVAAQIWESNENECRYLFLDEPLTFLDIYYQFDFLNKLKVLLSASDLIVVGVVHDLHLAAKFADNISLLYNGQVLADGSVESVLTKENIKTAYRLDAEVQSALNGIRLQF